MIGGAPGAGKTTLGSALATCLGGISMTMDPLIRAIRVATSAETHPALHRQRGHLEYFTDSRPDELVADAIELSEATWPAVQAVVRRWRRSWRPLVLDWWLLSPERLAPLEGAGLRSLWLHIDPATLEERERANTQWREGSRDPEAMHDHFMARSLWRNELVREAASRHGLALIHQPGGRSVRDLVVEALGVLQLRSIDR